MSWGNRTAKVRLFFGEGDFEFALLVAQLQELQDIAGAGPGGLLDRIKSGASVTWVQDVKHTLRLGLIGGGMGKEEAHRLVERQVHAAYLLDCALVAIAVLGASYVGVEEERSGEKKGRARKSRPSPTAGSDGATSSAPPPRLASRRPKRANARSGN